MGNIVGKGAINEGLVKLTCLGITKEKKKISENFIKGHHETEICYGGESDLLKHYTSCKKNPGHVNFIPVDDFNLGHLPGRYSDVSIFYAIKSLAALTVLIKVNYTSLDRPESVSFHTFEYPFLENRGSDVMRTGTGRIWAVNKYINNEIMGTCPCSKCQLYGGSNVWAEIDIVTATHVVFDQSEVKQTQCVLNFNSSGSKVITLNGLEIVGKPDVERDWCMFKCVSCDLELIEELVRMCRRFNDLCKTVFYKNLKPKLVAIVSHPHGHPKMVSIGRCTEKHEREGDMYKYTKYTYTTPTCPGSSGAFVYTMAFDKLSLSHPHSGSNSNGNYSGEDWLSLE